MHRPIRVSQSWQHTSYDFEQRKWKLKPTFYVKQTEGDKSKKVSLKKGLELIRQDFLPVTHDLSEWLIENGHKDLANHTPEEIQKHREEKTSKKILIGNVSKDFMKLPVIPVIIDIDKLQQNDK